MAVAAFAGMPVAKSLHLFQQNIITTDEILKQVSLPLFVKPNNGGSSIGISKVSEASALEEALCKAFKEDTQVLVEEFVAGREFTIGVFKSKGEIIALPITEIISKKDFFDYEAKYEGASDEVTPANVAADIATKIRLYATTIYSLFNCKGIVRMDFIYNEKKMEPVLLEINSVPGQSAASIVPQQVVAMGWSLKEFYSALIEECLV